VVLEQFVLDDLCVRAAFEFDDDADAVAVGLVAQVGDALDLALVDVLGDALDEAGLVGLEGEFGDDDPLAARLPLLDFELGADPESPAAGLVGRVDGVPADDVRPVGKSGAFTWFIRSSTVASGCRSTRSSRR